MWLCSKLDSSKFEPLNLCFFSKMAESDSKMAASPLHREESPAEDHLHRSSNLPLAAHEGTCWKLTTAENLQKFQILQRPMTRTTFPPTFSELLLVAYASAVHKNAKQGSHAWKKNRRVNLMQEWASLHQHHQWCLNLAFLLILQLHHTSSPSPWYDQAMRSSAAFILPDRSKSGWMGPPSFQPVWWYPFWSCFDLRCPLLVSKWNHDAFWWHWKMGQDAIPDSGC